MIIVGNGSSLLNQQNGHLIDSFHEVVRFNDFKIKNYEKFVGETVTHWWNTVNFQNLSHHLLQNRYNEVCLHSWQFSPEKDLLWRRLLSKIHAENIFKSQEQWIFELQQFAKTKYYGFSTGLLAIWYYLKSRPKITITGFDWWNTDVHHYGDNAIRGNLHKPREEKKIIDQLVNCGKIEWLK